MTNQHQPLSTHGAIPTDLAHLRGRIDAIDEAMHRLLMERGDIIDALIQTKKSHEAGSAFRPQREADMMRRLAERHHGSLPLEIVESLWRTIIGTFTWLQMPYNVHADTSLGIDVVRDIARFHFGFSVPLYTHALPDEVIDSVAQSTGDLGIIRFEKQSTTPWWKALEADCSPKIIARLPFIERDKHAKRAHPVGEPAFVISHPLGEGHAHDSTLLSVSFNNVIPEQELLYLNTVGFDIVTSVTSDGDAHTHCLIDADCRNTSIASTSELFKKTLKNVHSLKSVHIIGNHAARLRVL